MGFFLDIILSGIEDAIIKPLDKVEVLLSDPEIDGKKAGYERASKEYEKVYNALKQEHKEIMEQIRNQKITYDVKSDTLIERLARLEEKRDVLKERVRHSEKKVSEKYHIPVETVHSAVLSGGLIGGTPTIDLFGLIYDYKKKKFMEAEKRGYAEARSICEEKLRKLKKEMREEKQKGYAGIQNLIDLMCDVFEEISEIQMEIADLEILL